MNKQLRYGISATVCYFSNYTHATTITANLNQVTEATLKIKIPKGLYGYKSRPNFIKITFEFLESIPFSIEVVRAFFL